MDADGGQKPRSNNVFLSIGDRSKLNGAYTRGRLDNRQEGGGKNFSRYFFSKKLGR